MSCRGIENLPVEILGLVFISLNSTWTNASVTIASVCHHWRTVVLATPRAWTNIQIDLDHNHNPTTLLTRSLPHTIDNLDIVGQCHDLGVLQDHILPKLNDHLPRIRKILVEPSRDTTLVGIVSGLRGAAPLLEEIKASGLFWHASQAFSNITTPQNLKSIDFQGCLAPFPCGLLSHTLTTLRITSPIPPTSIHLIVGALRQCSQELEHFTFHGLSHWDPEPALPTTHVNLPRLTSMDLTLDDAASVLVYLSAPALQDLSLQRKISTRNNQPEFAVSDFLVRSGVPPVKRLVVDNVGMGPEAWLRCLRALPQLEALTSKDAGFSDVVLDAMRVKSVEEILCPKLETWTTALNFSTNRVLVDFLHSRNPPRRRRNIPTMSPPPPPPERERTAVVACIKGLELHGCRPNDTAMRNIEFIMLASDPMRDGLFEHHVKVVSGV